MSKSKKVTTDKNTLVASQLPCVNMKCKTLYTFMNLLKLYKINTF